MSSELSHERPPKISAKQKPRFPRDSKKLQALLRAHETPNAARSLVEIALTLSLCARFGLSPCNSSALDGGRPCQSAF